jgi:hypothetical protein
MSPLLTVAMVSVVGPSGAELQLARKPAANRTATAAARAIRLKLESGLENVSRSKICLVLSAQCSIFNKSSGQLASRRTKWNGVLFA